jgi:hypothetical protein
MHRKHHDTAWIASFFGDKADWPDIVLWNALTAFSEFARVGLRPGILFILA